MPRCPYEAKTVRVVRFLTGLRHPRVGAALRAVGFSEYDRQEGYARLAAVSAEAFRGSVALNAPPEPDPLDVLDAWWARWRPVLAATLRHRAPALHVALLGELSGAHGPDVLVCVGELLRRWSSTEIHARPEFDAARALLAARGFDRTVREEAQQALDAMTAGPLPARPRERDRAAERVALDALWAWYLEWSALVRAGTRDPIVLTKLGFAGPGGRPRSA